MQQNGVIITNVARCRDCYRCVRACPVKAVRVKEGQAHVVPELCIACGSCVCACPQKAKNVRDDRPIVQRAIQNGQKVVATVAPSFPAYFNVTSFLQIEEVLKGLGFSAAEETAYGAQMVGSAHRDLVRAKPEAWPVITSSCPAIVNLIEKYYPDLIPHVAPVVSPMIAHGRWLRQQHGQDACVVFIGPCIAKKEEILDRAVAGAVDAALTFDELREWMEAKDVRCPERERAHDGIDRSNARLFPVEGGLVGTANMDTDRLTYQIVTATGIDACTDVLRSIRAEKLKASLVELNACEGSCINGPAMKKQESAFLAQAAGDRIRLGVPAEDSPLPFRMASLGPDLYRQECPATHLHRRTNTGSPRTRRKICPRGRAELRRLRLSDLPRKGRCNAPWDGRGHHVHPLHAASRRINSTGRHGRFSQCHPDCRSRTEPAGSLPIGREAVSLLPNRRRGGAFKVHRP